MNSKPSPKKYSSLQIVLIVALVAGYAIYESRHRSATPLPQATTVERAAVSDSSAVAEAWRAHRSDVIVEGSGTVKKVLPDDNEGSRHQKLIVDVGGGLSVLIAHNIDLAERASVRSGDAIRFRGEYEWNEKGGVVHWTHHDPAGRHADGWLKVGDRTFQ